MKNWKELNKAGLLSLILPGYKINKWITGPFFFIGVFLILWALLFEGSLNFESNQYLSCESVTPCFNPYYSFAGPCPSGFDCSRELLNPGEVWGKKPSKVFDWAPFVLLSWVFVGLFVNHVLYNRDYPFRKRWKEIKEDLKNADYNNGDN